MVFLLFSIVHIQLTASPVRKPDAHTGIFHGAGNSCIRMAVIHFLYRFQSLCKSGGIIYKLTVWKLLSRTDRVAVADLPGRNANLFCHFCKKHFHCKAGLGNAKPAESSGRWTVCIVGFSVNIKILVIIGTGGMGTGSLKHRASQRGIGSGICYNSCFHTLNDTVFITAHSKFHVHGVAFGMDSEYFPGG